MANNIVQYNSPLPPAPARSQARIAAGQGIANRFTSGISMPFPVLSLKGKCFTLKWNDQDHPFVANGAASPIDVVLVNSSPFNNKSWYARGYDGVSNDAPDCWSIDGVTPSNQAALKQSNTCAGCKWNQFGTALRQDGVPGRGKACADSRRLVLAWPDDLLKDDLGPVALRVPVTSHKMLKGYIDYLAKAGYEPNACVTRLHFVLQEAYPILTFAFVRPLHEEEYEMAIRWETDERTDRIMGAPPEGDEPSSARPEPSVGFASLGQPVAGAPPSDALYVAQKTYVPPAQAAAAAAPPPVQPASVVPPAAAPKPDGVFHPARAAEPASVIITLPDGRKYDPVTKQYIVEAPPPPPPAAAPSTVIDLPDGRKYDTATQKYVDDVPADMPADVGVATWKAPATAPSYDPQGTPGAEPPATPPKRQKKAAPAEAPAPEQVEAKTQQQAAAAAAPKANGPAQPSPKNLDSILAGLKPSQPTPPAA